jgi:hypothetical protein
MYRRIVFVGLGGSGGKTIRFLKRDLTSWLTAHGWDVSERGIPRGFQFLHIDTPTVQDGVSMGGADMLPDSEYLGLVGRGVDFQAVTNALDSRSGVLEEQAGWRVRPPLDVPISTGAGAFRAVGRTIAAAQINLLRDGIQNLINRVNAPSAISDNSELWTITQDKPLGNLASPVVVVISSLAGGTGAGLLLDTFDLLRSAEPTWGGDSFGILYTPEVFRSIGGGLMAGIQPNSLAAISEILNGYYWHGSDDNRGAGDGIDIGLKSSRIHSGAGAVGAIASSGPAYPFLVGSTNSSNVAFSTDKQVFETIGSALVAWCVDEVVQDELIAFTMSNWVDRALANVGKPDLLVNQGADNEWGLPAFNAIGCARVSVGTRFFERYSAQRLARDAATYIAGYHMESDEAKSIMAQTGVVDPELTAERIAGDKMTWFLKETGLRERGTDENDIIDSLRPVEYSGKWESAVNTARQLADIQKGSASQWLDSIASAVREATVQFDTEMRPYLEARVRSWVETKPGEVIRVVEESIANYGLKVTVKILDNLSSYLIDPTEGVSTELMGAAEHQAYSQWASEAEWSQQAAAALGTSKGNFTMQSNEKVGGAIRDAMHYSCFVVEAQIREYASVLLKEFVEGFVVPLRRKLADESVFLETSINDITAWPPWAAGDPTGDCRPPSSEFTLIDPASFHDLFLELLSSSVGDVDKLERTTHRSLARTDILSGAFLRKMEAEAGANDELVRPIQAIQVSQTWVPSVAVLRDTNKPRASIVVDLKFKPEHLARRAEVWLRRDGTAFNDLLSSTLRTYTSGSAVFAGNVHVSEVEYEQRRTRFIGQLRAAIEASAPLVQLDLALHPTIHPVKDLKRQFTKFPFNGHPLQSAVANLIRPHIVGQAGDVNDGQLNGYFVNDASIESVQIMSTLNGAHHPVLFKSLLSPIAQRWNSEKDVVHSRDAFWSKRRARLAGEAIPAPQEHIICMIRGWFTGRVLGLIDVPRNGNNRPILISQPWSIDRAAASFPHPMLSTPTNDAGDELFAVLEALGLALVNVGVVNNTTPLLPYIALREMGSMRDGSQRILAYEQPNPLIVSWIETGKLVAESEGRSKDAAALRAGLQTSIDVKLAATPDDPAARREALLGLFTSILESYASRRDKYFSEAVLHRNRLSSPPLWTSLRTTSAQPDLIARAVRQLIDAIEQFGVGSPTGY